MMKRLAVLFLIVGMAFADGASEPFPWTDRSGSITLGGTAQTIAPVNTRRTYILVQNISDTAMWLNLGATATAGAGSLLLTANGGSYAAEGSAIPSGAVSILCATTGKEFTAKEMNRAH